MSPTTRAPAVRREDRSISPTPRLRVRVRSCRPDAWDRHATQRIERPGEILERVAQMRHFPIEDRPDIAVRIGEEISRAIVAMHDRDFLRRRRWVAPQPADGGPRDRLGLALVFVDHLFPAREFVAPARARIARTVEIAETDIGGIGFCDAPQDAPELLSDLLAMFAIGIGCEDRTRAAIRNFFHDEERPLERCCVQFERDGFGNRQSQFVKGAIGAEFGRPVGFDQARHRIAAQHQRAFDGPVVLRVMRAKAIGLPARPARDARKIRHDEIRRRQFRREIALQPDRKVLDHVTATGFLFPRLRGKCPT